MNQTKPKGKISFVLFRLTYSKATQKQLFMPVHFSDREMKKAWKNNLQAYDLAQTKTNAHRLLLFYSTECGLKAALMKRQSKTSTEGCQEILGLGHNINRLLDTLNAEQNLRLPNKIKMISSKEVSVDEINQMWRYGGEAHNKRDQNGVLVKLTDEDLEKHLVRISNWIKGELHS